MSVLNLTLNFGLLPGRRVPLFMQSTLAECGTKCLAMVAAYFGDHAALTPDNPLAQRGATLGQLAEQAAALGLLTRALRLEPHSLWQLQRPAILHWDLDHFVVLVRSSKRRAIVHDPARGRISLSLDELAQHFTGVALELQPGPEFVPRGAAQRLRLRDLLSGAQGLGASAVRIGLLSLLVQLLLLASPLYLQWVVDEALNSADWDLLAVLALAFGLLLLLQIGVQYVRDWLVVSIGNALALRMSSGVAVHLLALPLLWFSSRRTGDIFARFRSLAPVTGFLARGLPTVLVDGAMALLALVLLLVYQPMLGALVVASTLLYTLLRTLTFQAFRRRTLDQVEAQARQESQFLETLRGIHTIKAFGQENVRYQRWQQALVEELNAGIALSRFGLSYDSAHRLVFGVELLLVVYLGAHSVLEGALSLGMLFAFLSYRSHFTQHVSAFIAQWLEFRTLGVNLERLADICLSEREVDGVTPTNRALNQAPTAGVPRTSTSRATAAVAVSTFDFAGWRGDLCCQELAVTAPGQTQPLLAEVNLAIGAGEFLAIVGDSGMGKTSLLNCLMGLQPPAQGRLCAGKAVLQPQDLPAYRGCLGSVQQQDKLFAGTLLDNVSLFAVPTAQAQQRASELLALVGLGEFVESLPMGMATTLGELGTGLSGGQAQRMVLARALYRQPKVLFLDEVTANLDPQSAAYIQQLIVELPVTRVVVTHDHKFAMRSDRAFALQGKRLCKVDTLSVGTQAG